MKVAVTAQDKGPSSEIDLRFGQAKWIIVVDTEAGELEEVDRANVEGHWI